MHIFQEKEFHFFISSPLELLICFVQQLLNNYKTEQMPLLNRVLKIVHKNLTKAERPEISFHVILTTTINCRVF